MCISTAAWLWHSCLHYDSFEVVHHIFKTTESRPPTLNDYTLHVVIQTHSIIASKFITMLIRSWPLCSSPILLNLGLSVDTIMATRWISTSLRSFDYCLQSQTIMASKCIFNLLWSWPSRLHDHGLHVCLLISKFAQSQPPSSHHHNLWGSLSTLFFCSPSASLHSLTHRLQVHQQTCFITSFMFT